MQVFRTGRKGLSRFIVLGVLAVVLLIASLAAAEPRTRGLAINTLIAVSSVVALSVPAGTLLALLLVRTDLPGRRAAMRILGLMLLVPLYLQAAAWQAGFGLQGWFPAATGGRMWLEGWTAVCWIHAMAAVPWVVWIVGSGLRLVEPELEEQALLDGSARQVFLRVTLPAAMPAVGVAALWVAIAVAGEMTVTDLFAVRTYAEEIYTRLAVEQELGAGPLGLVSGTMLVLSLAAIGLLVCTAIAPGDRLLSLRRQRLFQLRAWRWPLAAAVLLVMLLVAAVPLGNLLYQAGEKIVPTGGATLETWSPPLRSWSAAKCIGGILRGLLLHPREFGASALIAGLAATTAVGMAIPLAALARRGRGWSLPLLLPAGFLAAIPGPVLGLSIIWLLDRPELPGLAYLYSHSILAPWLALTARAFPPAALIVWHALQTVPREMMECAAVDGAGPWTRLLRIALPTVLPALAAAWLVGLAVALGDLAASILVVPPGVKTLSIQVFELLHYGVQDRVAGICLALVALFVVVAALAGGLMRVFGRDWPSPTNYN